MARARCVRSSRSRIARLVPTSSVSSPLALASKADALERSNLFRDGALGRQPLHRARAVEAVDAAAVLQDVLGVRRLRDRPAVADDDDVAANAAGGVGDVLDAGDAVVERLRALGA